jgi:hypothetical protein
MFSISGIQRVTLLLYRWTSAFHIDEAFRGLTVTKLVSEMSNAFVDMICRLSSSEIRRPSVGDSHGESPTDERRISDVGHAFSSLLSALQKIVTTPLPLYDGFRSQFLYTYSPIFSSGYSAHIRQ